MPETNEIREYGATTETDPQVINREFIKAPDSKVVLLATNLSRPDGFIKALICGEIATSAELQLRIDPRFVRTHRGYYMAPKPRYGEMGTANDYLSFSVGAAQKLYASSRPSDSPWRKGLGIATVADKMINTEPVEVVYGNFGLRKLIENIRKRGASSPLEEKILEMSVEELKEYDLKPPVEDLYELVQLTRREGLLCGDDQAEIRIIPEEGRCPRVKMSDTIIFIPARSRDAFERLMKIKIKDCVRFSEEIRRTFGVDVTSLTADKVLEKYRNIYWYPQANIDLAVKYLTTHPDSMKMFLH